MNSRDFAIGILSVTAVVLLCALIIVQTAAPREAAAFSQNATAGQYVMSTAQLDERTELLCVMDANVQFINVYAFNNRANTVELIAPFNMRVPRKMQQEEKKEGE